MGRKKWGATRPIRAHQAQDPGQISIGNKMPVEPIFLAIDNFPPDLECLLYFSLQFFSFITPMLSHSD